jgi:hypothetical protein
MTQQLSTKAATTIPRLCIDWATKKNKRSQSKSKIDRP